MATASGMILNPGELAPGALSAILAGISDAEWDVPDIQPAIKHAGIADARYLRQLLGLPAFQGRRAVGDLIVATAHGYVIARLYTLFGSGAAFVWRRFPLGTTEDEVRAVLPARKPRPLPLPTAASVRAEATALRARLDAVEAAASALEAVEAAQEHARAQLAALRVTR
jgi:hypothetical protein